eukprot:1958-Ditylum_brightwellii.AAC.1
MAASPAPSAHRNHGSIKHCGHGTFPGKRNTKTDRYANMGQYLGNSFKLKCQCSLIAKQLRWRGTWASWTYQQRIGVSNAHQAC